MGIWTLIGRLPGAPPGVAAGAGAAGVGTGIYAMTHVQLDSSYAFGNQLLNVTSITLGAIDTTLSSGEALLPAFEYSALGLSKAAGPIGLALGAATDLGGIAVGYYGTTGASARQFDESTASFVFGTAFGLVGAGLGSMVLPGITVTVH
jgi:hypothetical protein